MWTPRLHLPGRKVPDRFIQVELAPFGMPKLARPHEHVGSDAQRGEMIGGMVARLADRLKRDGSDVEGWLRLVRAYVVLGERDKANATIVDARRALASDPGKVRRIDDLAKGLGLSG